MRVIGIWGDSITWGGYDQEVGGWVTRLRHYCDANFTFDEAYSGGPSVYNLGIWGDKVADVLRRFEVEYNARRTETIILAIGINDSPHQSHPEGTAMGLFEDAYRALLANAKYVSQKILIVGPTNVVDEHPRNRGYKNSTIKPYAAALETIAKEHNLTYIDVFGLMNSEDVGVDGVHPSASGHEKIFQKVKAAVS